MRMCDVQKKKKVLCGSKDAHVSRQESMSEMNTESLKRRQRPMQKIKKRRFKKRKRYEEEEEEEEKEDNDDYDDNENEKGDEEENTIEVQYPKNANSKNTYKELKELQTKDRNKIMQTSTEGITYSIIPRVLSMKDSGKDTIALKFEKMTKTSANVKAREK
ncbi:hypothetical protein RFI_04248, partial [Reticulomyxa filosa]